MDGLETSAKLYKVAAWYEVMMLSYGNVVSHAAMAQYQGLKASVPRFGSAYDDVHLGMGFRLGMVWTILFNLLAPAVNVYADATSTIENEVKQRLIASQRADKPVPK